MNQLAALSPKALVLRGMRNIAQVVIASASMFALAGCEGTAEWIAVRLFYREAVLARAQVYKDLNYRDGPSAHQRKHRLDFYVPEGAGWPVLIFVHGGSWRKGDKALKFRDRSLWQHWALLR